MELVNVLKATIFAGLWLSWIAVIVAALPTGFALTVTTPRNKFPYLLAGLLGGIAGEFCATSSMFLGDWWSCRSDPRFCYDGQADMGLIYTIPALSLLGSIAALIWTSFTLRVRPDLPWASVFRYTGSRRFLNLACAVAPQLLFWPLLALATFRLST